MPNPQVGSASLSTITQFPNIAHYTLQRLWWCPSCSPGNETETIIIEAFKTVYILHVYQLAFPGLTTSQWQVKMTIITLYSVIATKLYMQ